MRQDQFEKLQALEEKMLDVFIAEADPEKWPGKGVDLATMDRGTRGDLLWCRRTASYALVLANKIASTINAAQQFGGTTPAPDSDDGAANLDAEILSAEREAAKLMRELQSGSAPKPRKAHGRAAS